MKLALVNGFFFFPFGPCLDALIKAIHINIRLIASSLEFMIMTTHPAHLKHFLLLKIRFCALIFWMCRRMLMSFLWQDWQLWSQTLGDVKKTSFHYTDFVPFNQRRLRFCQEAIAESSSSALQVTRFGSNRFKKREK